MAADAEQALLQFAVRREPARVDDAVDAPVDHDRDTVGDGGRDADILLDDEDCDVAFGSEPDQHLLDLRDDDGREPLGRLVHDEEVRVGDERPADREHLLLAAGELPAAVAAPFGEAGKDLVDALDSPRTLLSGRDHSQMLVDGERSPEATTLRHVAKSHARDVGRRPARQLLPAHADRAARRRNEAHDRLAERRLAHAVAADDREHALLKREVDALQGMRTPVIDVEPLDLQHGAGIGDAGFSHVRLRDKAPALRGRIRSPAARLP